MPKLKPTCPRKTKNSWSPWNQSSGLKWRKRFVKKLKLKLMYSTTLTMPNSNCVGLLKDLSALEVCSRRGAIQIHVYRYLYHFLCFPSSLSFPWTRVHQFRSVIELRDARGGRPGEMTQNASSPDDRTATDHSASWVVGSSILPPWCASDRPNWANHLRRGRLDNVTKNTTFRGEGRYSCYHALHPRNVL